MSDVEEPPTKVTEIELALPTGPNESMVSLEEGQEEWLSESVMTDEDYNTSQDNNSAHNTSQESIEESNQSNLEASQDVSQDISQYVNEVNETNPDQSLSIELSLTQEQDMSEQLSPTFTQEMTHVEDEYSTQAQDGNETHEAHVVSQDNEEAQTQLENEPEIQEMEQTQHEVTQEVSNQEEAMELIENVTENAVEENDQGMEQGESVLNSVEESLNNMENSESQPTDHSTQPPAAEERDILDELDTFLIRKSAAADKGSNERSAKNSDDDDGHNTDELLEMLGEDKEKKKRKKMTSKQPPKKATLATAESSDDEGIFHGLTKITHLKVAKNAIIKKCSVKQPDLEKFFEDSDMSDDEEPPPSSSRQILRTSSASKSLLRTHYDKPEVKLPTSTPLRTYSRRGQQARSLLRRGGGEGDDAEEIFEKDEEEKQRIMKPEEMDEELPSDMESGDSDDSFYDELPSSDSELDDWFAIDIRAERAADYIPLLGYKAYEILSEEKRRVASRIEQLRGGLSALARSSRDNSADMQRTRRALREVEGQLALS